MTNEAGGSVSRWIGDLRDGDMDEAAQHLWSRYFDQLARLARSKLHSAPHGPADEEDVALSAFDSFFRGAATGEFPRLGDRNDLWRLLVTITARKASNQRRRERQAKRGGGKVVGENAFDAADNTEGLAFDQIVGQEPTPEFAAMVAEECRLRLSKLPDETLRQVALLRMEGYSNEEIASQLGTSLRSVERKLELIRKRWHTAEDREV